LDATSQVSHLVRPHLIMLIQLYFFTSVILPMFSFSVSIIFLSQNCTSLFRHCWTLCLYCCRPHSLCYCSCPSYQICSKRDKFICILPILAFQSSIITNSFFTRMSLTLSMCSFQKVWAIEPRCSRRIVQINLGVPYFILILTASIIE